MMSVAARLPWELTGSKIQDWHRDRLAVVYVRQSTAAQVADHGESTRLQYGLAERAAALGWAPSRVLVIDEDLGHSASGADARPGLCAAGRRGGAGSCGHRAGHRDVPAGPVRPRMASAAGAVCAVRGA